MKSITEYNGLNGVVSRDFLSDLVSLSNKEEQFHIALKLKDVLLSNPEEESFDINLTSKETEIPPQSILKYLEVHKETETIENLGLSKGVNPSVIYDMITQRMLDLIKEASSSGYKKKWKARVYGKGYTIPFNFESKKRYRGVNLFLLTNFKPIENPYFLTFKQIEKNKGKLKKGSKASPVVYFTKLYKYEQAEPKLYFASYDKKKLIKFLKDNKAKISLTKHLSIESIANQSYLPILKYYNVFNGKDIEGIDFDLDNFKIGYINQPIPSNESSKLPIAEAIIKRYPKPVPKLSFGGDRAYYSPSTDRIKMPYIADFDTIQDYYRTLFHEYSHSTGAEGRLERDFSGKFGTKKYAFEELVAEWGAVFLSAEAGIIYHSNLNHAAYLKNWNTVLTSIKDDNKFIMRACTQAQKVADYILQFDANGNPKYLKHLKKKEAKQLALFGAKTNKGLGFTIEKMSGDSYSPFLTKKKEEQKEVVAVVEKGFSQAATSPAHSNNSKPMVEIKNEKPNIASKPSNTSLPEGFTLASEKPSLENLPGLFYLPGEIGKWLNKLQRYKLMMLVHGESGAGKSELVKQLVNAFIDAGFSGGFFDIEQGGLISKDTQESLDRNIPKQNLDKIAFTAEAPNGLQTVKSVANNFDFVVVDSWQKLKAPMTQLDDLRNEYPNTIWIIITQETTDGKAKGGSQASFDPPIRIKAFKVDNTFKNNYAELMKNRGNQQTIGTKYNIFHKQLVIENKDTPKDISNFIIESFNGE